MTLDRKRKPRKGVGNVIQRKLPRPNPSRHADDAMLTPGKSHHHAQRPSNLSKGMWYVGCHPLDEVDLASPARTTYEPSRILLIQGNSAAVCIQSPEHRFRHSVGSCVAHRLIPALAIASVGFPLRNKNRIGPSFTGETQQG